MFFRHPAIHFIAIGAVLFAVQQWRASGYSEDERRRSTIEISTDQLTQMRADFAAIAGDEPTSEEEAALIRSAVDEEILYRESLALGLDRFDRSIRYRLLQKMRFLEGETLATDEADLIAQARDLELDHDDIVIRRILVQKMKLLVRASVGEISEAELERYYSDHREDYLQPPTITFRHVFLSADLRGDALEADAARMRTELLARGETGSDRARGDPFPLDTKMRGSSERSVAKVFGDSFAARVFQIEARHWSDPVVSPYGVHLVWVEGQEPERSPPFEAVRSQIEQRLRSERGEAKLAALLETLRPQYEVRVESEPAA